MALISPFDLHLHHFDLCVVGMGPAGMTLALEAQQHGLTVLLVEQGSLEGSETPTLPAHFKYPEQHVSLSLGTYHGLGGTSWLWGGRCLPFESIDFTKRNYVPYSGWPLTEDDVKPWYDIAAKYTDCGNSHFRDPNKWQQLHTFELSMHERWSKQPKLAKKLRQQLIDAPNIYLLTETSVDKIILNTKTTEIHHLLAHWQKHTINLCAKHYVLACGGIATTHLLLKTQQQHPHLFGGKNGPLGRYYMGHIFGSVADIILNNPQNIDDLDYYQDNTDTYIRKRFTLPPQIQERLGVLNTSFYIENPPFYDASHGNSTLSLVFIALSIPFIGRRLLGEAIRLKHLGPKPYQYLPHIMNVIRHPIQATKDIIDIIRYRYLAKVRRPGFILKNKTGIYTLNFHAEQLPNPDNRISLHPSHPAEVDIDFTYTEQDIDSVFRLHELLDRDLQESGYGHLQYHVPLAQLKEDIAKQAADGYHQVGSVRMGSDPKTSIVNKDSQTHDITNLFIASSAIFPTTGEANPTFLITALAARLAQYLATETNKKGN